MVGGSLSEVSPLHRNGNGGEYVSGAEVGKVVGGLGVSEEELDILMCNFSFHNRSRGI